MIKAKISTDVIDNYNITVFKKDEEVYILGKVNKQDFPGQIGYIVVSTKTGESATISSALVEYGDIPFIPTEESL
jgi:hypothetical protein